jgi:AGZA family xanthine/uracil permease-like MFS transporter
MTFFGDRIRRLVPQAGLLGSIGGVGIALLGTLQLGEVFSEPIAGMVAFGIILYALVARIRLPFRAPEVLASVLVGAVIYYALGATGLSVHPITFPAPNFPVALPTPTLGFIDGLPIVIREYIPLALPFAILCVIGGIDVTESARVAGDSYETRDVLLVEAIATLVAGFFGGVSQTTPYIGHPAYKAMGGRAAYTLATGLVVGLGGIFGYVAFVADALPKPVLAPILVFIGLEIAGQSYLAPPRRHAAAVTIAILPSVAQLVAIFLSQVQGGALMTAALDPELTARATGILNPAFIRTCGVMIMLANGFILTALLWGSAAAFLIDRKVVAASVVLAICGGLSFFGFIHSVLPSGGVYFPWHLTTTTLPYHWMVGYVGLAVLLLTMSSVTATADTKSATETH